MGEFSDISAYRGTYGQLLAVRGAREEREGLPEHALQRLWFERPFAGALLKTIEGQRLEIVSPGQWNQQEGPDFRNAQLRFNGRPLSGDVELHLDDAGWHAHGHQWDARYDDVILHVVLRRSGPPSRVATSSGRAVATLHLESYLSPALWARLSAISESGYTSEKRTHPGRCASLIPQLGMEPLHRVLSLAGEWRVLNKARALQQRIEQVGKEQALYEAFLAACGYRPFKENFRAIARALPYARAHQLVTQDPLLLEAAWLQLAGLIPEAPAASSPYLDRVLELKRSALPGLRRLPLEWRRNGVRPVNGPERRLSGAARVLARSKDAQLAQTLENVWRAEVTVTQRRRMFESLFPGATGFWAEHLTWSGARIPRPTAPIGAGRIRSIIGNVFVPAALAMARLEHDRAREELVYDFLGAMPKEPDNQITREAALRVGGPENKLKLTFQRQQGLVQLTEDWCERNPSCGNCSLYRYLSEGGAAAASESCPTAAAALDDGAPNP